MAAISFGRRARSWSGRSSLAGARMCGGAQLGGGGAAARIGRRPLPLRVGWAMSWLVWAIGYPALTLRDLWRRARDRGGAVFLRSRPRWQPRLLRAKADPDRARARQRRPVPQDPLHHGARRGGSHARDGPGRRGGVPGHLDCGAGLRLPQHGGRAEGAAALTGVRRPRTGGLAGEFQPVVSRWSSQRPRTSPSRCGTKSNPSLAAIAETVRTGT